VLKYAIRRFLALIPLLIIISMSMFVLAALLPGDAAVIAAGDNATPEAIEEARVRLGLDDPLPVRYVEWAGDALHGDLGRSSFASTDVTTAIKQRFPVTLSLTLVALTISVMIGVPAGIIAALRVNSRFDRLLVGSASLFVAVPPFVAGLFLVRWFAISRDWFPATGYVSISEGGFWEWLHHLILPGFALAMVSIGYFTRQTRSAFVDVLGRDYVRTARAKGMKQRVVVGKHMAKAAAIPIVTAIGLTIGRIVGGSVVVESIFAISGFGSLIIGAINTGDIYMLQGIVIVIAIIVLTVNLLVDLSYGVLDPKIRKQ
jgi:peptide/nickel transport system permease protein